MIFLGCRFLSLVFLSRDSSASMSLDYLLGTYVQGASHRPFGFYYQVAVVGLNPRSPDYQAKVLQPDHCAPKNMNHQLCISINMN